MSIITIFLSTITILFNTAAKEPVNEKPKKKSNVIVLVIDGPRYSETFGDTSREHIPNLTQLANKGAFYPNFYNNGVTFTNPGHTAITTGVYEALNNSGFEIPSNPSIFNYFIEQNNNDTLAYIIASKDKLEVLANSSNSTYHNRFQPLTDCGNNGNGTGYRNDSITMQRVFATMQKTKPQLMLINLREPDYAGHGGNYENYLKQLKQSDLYALQLWNFIQTNANYKNNTTLFITNDHGRHLDDIKDGFISHGDNCQGCKHISCIVLGPTIVPGNKEIFREQIDIPATIAQLLGFNMPTGTGKVMEELFTK